MANDSHEEIHLPGPSAAPIIVAAGMTLSLLGLLNALFLIVGIVTLVVGIAFWAFVTD